MTSLLEASLIGVLSPETDKRDGMDMSTADKAKGKIKEALGSMAGSDDLAEKAKRSSTRVITWRKRQKHMRWLRSMSVRLSFSSMRSGTGKAPEIAHFRLTP